jgi:Methyltransferase domain
VNEIEFRCPSGKSQRSIQRWKPQIMTKTLADLFDDSGLHVERLDEVPAPLASFPKGWMSPLELKVLYNFARYGDGDFLEIGTWIGRSSTAIAMGFRDVGQIGRRLDLVDFGFVSTSDFADKLKMGNEYLLQDEICRPIMMPGGVIAVLIENLRSRDLLRFVTSVCRGNAAEVPLRSSYGVVFCDAVHSLGEIEVAGPVLARILKPGSWLICDDLCEQFLVEALEQYITFDLKLQLKELETAAKSMIGRVS